MRISDWSSDVCSSDLVLYVANFSARRFVRMTAGVGSRFPAYAVSMGRILLAALPDEPLEQYLATAEFAPPTPGPVTNPKALRKPSTQVRRESASASCRDNGFMNF